MRSACVALGLLGCVSAARADWQPLAAPPVPPETENAQRERVAPGVPRSAVPEAERPSAARVLDGSPPSAASPHEAEGQPSAAGQRGAGGSQPSAAARVELAQAPRTPAQGRLDTEAMRVFPPAPPPVVPGVAPEKPNTALTSFAPAPAPDASTGGAGGAAPGAVAAGPGSVARSAGALAPGAANGNVPAAGAAVPVGAAAHGGDAGVGGARATADRADETGVGGPVPGARAAADRSAGTGDAVADAHNTGPAADSGVEAQPPGAQPAERWSAAALVGVGATFDNTVAGVNPLGFGFGVRGDYRLLPSWSLGARMLYFVGGSVELPTHDVVVQSWLLAAEGAYVLQLEPLTIQPGLALGVFVRETNYRGFATFITEDPTSLSPPDTTRLYFYVAPGINVSLPLALVTPALAPLTVGADVRLDLAFGRRVTSNIQLLAQVGLRF